MKKALSTKNIAISMAFISLISFAYKFIIGVLATSLVMIIASIPTFFVFICKATYAKNMNQSRKDKKRAYLIMSIFAVAYVALFVCFSILKVGNIDITNQNRFEGWIGVIFIFFIILLFVLSIINLRGALNKSDIVVIGIKEISFIAAMSDAMMIQEFLYRVIFSYINIPFMGIINRYFPLIVGIIMIIVPISMFKRYITFKDN